jgi:glycosyltransferase involved in cell wall biosynthesis
MDNSKAPLVSVVFTSYNHEKFLKQAIDSIINQSFKDYEFIIIDDCSTDRSREIISTYADVDHVVLHLLEQNTGSYVKASHYGALRARGKYLLFAQCDDYSESTQLSALVNVLTTGADNIGVVFSRSNMVDSQGAFISDDYSLRNKAFKTKCKTDCLISGDEMRSFLSYACVIPNLSAALIEKSLYFKVGGLPEKYLMAADWAFWLSLAEETNFYYLTATLNNFRQHDTTIRSKTKIDKQLIEIFTLFDEHIKQYKLKGQKKREMLRGFGNIWATYFLEFPSAVSSSFPKVIKEVSGKNSSMPYFLVAGILSKIKSILIK